MNNNNNRQSINNYSYSRRRNREPAQNGNNSDSTQRNNSNSIQRNNSNPHANSSSSMYNSYVSENNYNSYTSSYQSLQNNFNNYNQPPQNSFNSYNQPPQNNFNNYNQPSQSSFNNYNQPMQNIMPTYQGYDSQNSWAGGAVEVPIDRSAENSGMMILWFFGIPFVLGLVFAGIWKIFNVTGIVVFLMGLCFALSLFGLLIGAVASAVMEDARKRRVCTVAVTGQLAGYDSKRTRYRRSNNTTVSYTVYAPKYKIFINNRYKIRTLDCYTRNQNFAQQMFLLANPNGHEIIKAED